MTSQCVGRTSFSCPAELGVKRQTSAHFCIIRPCYVFMLHLTTLAVAQTRGAQIPDDRSPWRLSFISYGGE
jgi:hypothetical protein